MQMGWPVAGGWPDGGETDRAALCLAAAAAAAGAAEARVCRGRRGRRGCVVRGGGGGGWRLRAGGRTDVGG